MLQSTLREWVIALVLLGLVSSSLAGGAVHDFSARSNAVMSGGLAHDSSMCPGHRTAASQALHHSAAGDGTAVSSEDSGHCEGCCKHGCECKYAHLPALPALPHVELDHDQPRLAIPEPLLAATPARITGLFRPPA